MVQQPRATGEEKKKAAGGEQHKKPDLSGIAMKTPLNYLEERFGEGVLDKFLRDTGMDRKYFEDHNNWISFEYAHSIFRKIVELSEDDQVCLEVGKRLIDPENIGKAVWIAMKAVGNPSLVYKKMFDLGPIYNRVGVYRILGRTQNRMVLEYRPKEGYYEEDKCFCHYRIGNFFSIPTIWGIPTAKCRDLSCNVDGAEACTYEFTWQARRSHLVPMAGMALGAILAFLYSQAFSPEQNLGFWATAILLPLSGFLGDR